MICPRCGANNCREKYGEMLAPEFEQPAVFGAVHHITVTCYNLQHPAEFSDEALAWVKEALRDTVEHDLSGAELLKRVRGRPDGDFGRTAGLARASAGTDGVVDDGGGGACRQTGGIHRRCKGMGRVYFEGSKPGVTSNLKVYDKLEF